MALKLLIVLVYPRQDYAIARGSNDYNHLQEQLITTFSSWTEICNSFEVSILMMMSYDDVYRLFT